MINLRVVVQRCPAVPTAPNNAPMIDMSRLAFSVMIIALLPPNSSKALPNRSLTVFATALPIRVEPVADTNGISSFFDMSWPINASPFTMHDTPSGTPFFANTLLTIF